MGKLKHLNPYLAMLLLIIALTVVREALLPVMQLTGPVVVYFIAVAIAGLYTGLKVTLLTTFVSAALANYLFVAPRFSFAIADSGDAALLVVFVLVGIAFGLTGERHLRGRRKADELMQSLQQAKRDIELTERTTHALLESSSQGIFGIDRQGRIRIANGTAHRMFGYAPGELIGQSIDLLVDPQQRSAHAHHRAAFFEAPHAQPMMHGLDLQGRRKDGSLFPIEALITVTDTPTGRLGVSFISDITQRRAMEAALLRERSELRSLLDHTPVLVTMQNLDGRIHLANRSFAHLLGLEEQDMVGRHLSEVFPPHLAQLVEASNREVIGRGAPDELDFELCHRNGEVHYYHLVKFPLRYLDTEEPFGIGGFALDVTALKQAEDQARHAAQHDPLTGLANRSLVYELGSHLLDAARRQRYRLAVMFFDLDRFKPINDTYGHRVGDLMLKEVARRLRSTVRASDVVGRLGGDEFVALLTHMDSDADLESAATHLLNRLRQPYCIGALELRTSPSIGISIFPEDGSDIDELIRHADAAMYHAKHNGRNNYQYFSDEIRSNTARVYALEQRMRRSLQHEDFALAYQPVIDLRSRQVTGVEALIRWPQSDGSELMPADFIAAAEASGTIHQIGDWVLREACRQAQHWRAIGLPPMRVAVNVSPTQFRSPDFRRRVMAALECTALDPHCLELEVTESTVMSRVEEATQTLGWLKQLGLRIALDDFGTGYSSLSYLARLPIDKLKVDQSFVGHIDTDARSLAIAETVIALGQKLSLDVVAEGIETESALVLLRERGCTLGQGFLIGRPMRSGQLEAWLRLNAAAVA